MSVQQSVCHDILLIEPFYCGSHRQLMDCLMSDTAVNCRADFFSLSGKKWHWRARTSALYLSRTIPTLPEYRVLFASSVLNLAELVALRPDFAHLKKVLYFHENQLRYPVQKHQKRDFQYGYNQVMSCLVADMVLFNSKYNMESFLSSVNSFFSVMPDYRPKGLVDDIRPKCRVLYFPMVFHNNPCAQSKCGDRCMETKALSSQTLSRCNKRNNLMYSSSSSQGKAYMEPTEEALFCHCQHCHVKCKESTNLDSSNINEDTDLTLQIAPSYHHTSIEQQCLQKPSDPSMISVNSDLHIESKIVKDEILPSNTTVVLDTLPSGAHFSDFWNKEEKNLGHIFSHVSQGLSEAKDNTTAGAGVVRDDKDKCKKNLHIVWPHRWEHDKDPQTFFDVLLRLHNEELPFTLSVVGETFSDVPEIFETARTSLKGHVKHWGFQPKKNDYYQILQEGDVVVSTSKHEFFGVAMLEGVYYGCYPLCPRSLVYPEIYPDECLFSTPTQLYKRLRTFCKFPHSARQTLPKIDLEKFSWEKLQSEYKAVLGLND